MLKINLLTDIYKFHGQITRELLGLIMQNFQVIAFTSTQSNKQIFKSA